MKLRIDNPLKASEWLIAACGLLAAVASYTFLIEPSLELFSGREDALFAKDASADDLIKTRNQYQQLQDRIVAARTKLAELGGSPPLASEKDRLISRMTTLASATQLDVDQYSPLDIIEEEDHQGIYIQFAGQGTFAAIESFLQRIETELDFVDVTHFAVTAMPAASPPHCSVRWSCRVNGMRPPAPPSKVKAARPSQTPKEVALNEP
jgi:hypothetical protein